ncbi:MAG: ABC-type Fe3+ transport system protein [Labilithrix sp.]|nr:ABC-type Fe3+ transport system protein [Labilithrix sp.]
MADTTTEAPALLLAEFNTPGECLHAAEALREAGYKDFDTHTPFPVHGMDAAMGLGDSKLGLIVFPIGILGTTLAFTMIHWMNNIDYRLIIGGKPATVSSLPSMIPIMFELTVLLSSFAAVFGMLGLNKLPRHHHPVFNSERFKEFSNDKFFVSVESTDPKWSTDKTRALLEGLHPASLELVYDDDEGGEDLDEPHAPGAHA